MKKFLWILILPIGLYLAQGLINKYWFPPNIRILFLPPKFEAGQCVAISNIWGINPKKVVGTKSKGQEIFYLLKDDDKYEHLQYISKEVLDNKARRVPCSR